ncbi:Uncharacterised protein [Mycobacteroides abscessus subsp. abscessus]|nr:Uncharacterised protein [Mycobacteroides abscessus subsp. abscessus]
MPSLAPTLFSITTGWPQRLASPSAAMRADTSTGPPATAVTVSAAPHHRHVKAAAARTAGREKTQDIEYSLPKKRVKHFWH